MKKSEQDTIFLAPALPAERLLDAPADRHGGWAPWLEKSLLTIALLTLAGTAPRLWGLWFGSAGLPTGSPFALLRYFTDHTVPIYAGAGGGFLLAGYLLLNAAYRWLPANAPALRVTWMAAVCWFLLVLTLYFPDLLIVLTVRSR